jgi:DNA-binding NtrC family response regulator
MNGAMGAPADRRLVLFVDDEPDNLRLARMHFADEHELLTASNGEEALALLAAHDIWAIFTDERMPGMSGIELLERTAQRWPDVVRVIVSAYADTDRLLGAIHRGRAHEYVIKPWESSKLRACIQRSLSRAARQRRFSRQAELGERLSRAPRPATPMVGWQTTLAAVADLVRRAAPTEAPVLLIGETGTGKDLVARAVHAASARAAGPFVVVDCRALAEDALEDELFGNEGNDVERGRLELAAGGTVLLDDVDAMPLRVQGRLLRAVTDGRLERARGARVVDLDCRFLATTNHDLGALVRDGRFREDLYFALAIVPVRLPALRERIGDLKALVAHFVEKCGRGRRSAVKLGEGVLALLSAYDWPGNVRELENMVARALILSDGGELTIDDFTFVCPRQPSGDVRDEAQRLEAARLRELLLAHGGNAARAARALGVPRSTLVSRAQKLGVL